MSARIAISTAVIALLGCSELRAADAQYWFAARSLLLSEASAELGARVEVRRADQGRVDVFHLVSMEYRHRTRPWLQLGTNLTVIHSRPADPDAAFGSEFRFELEGEPRWRPAPWLTVLNRNRYELRWIEGRGWGHHRLRHRWEARASRGRFAASASDELFAETDGWRCSENRLTPLSLSAEADAGSVSLYVMLRSRRAGGGWSDDHVLGASLALRLTR